MQAVFEKSIILKKLIESIKDLVDEVNITFDSNGVSMESMDQSHVSMCCFLIHKDDIKSYKCSQNITVGVKMESFFKILKCSGDDDEATLDLKDRDDDKLAIKFDNNKKVQDFELKLMEIQRVNLQVPKMDFDCKIEIDSKSLQKTFRDMSSFGESCTLTVTEDPDFFITCNGETTTQKVKVKSDMDDEVSVSSSAHTELIFSLKFINFFMKAANSADKLTIKLSSEAPASFKFYLKDDKKSWIRFYLAPKQNED